MRKVLKHLKDYETIKTDHFVIRFDPKNDDALAHYMADYLEQIYADLSNKFQYQLKEPILIEVFNNHEMFSGRRRRPAGPAHGRRLHRPHVRHGFAQRQGHGQAVQLGPRPAARDGPHFQPGSDEFPDAALVHGRAGGQQRGLSPAAAVERPLPRAVPKDDLMDLDDIDLGFIRPRTPTGLEHGLLPEPALRRLHEGEVRRRLRGEDAGRLPRRPGHGRGLQKACGVEKTAFEKGYRAFLDETVKAMGGKPAVKDATLEELKVAHEKNPDDLDTEADWPRRT